MTSLKHEMREMFEKKQYGDIVFGRPGLEEGLVEKILNLSILNPLVFTDHPWSILLVKSTSGRQKLSKLSQDHPVFLDTSAALVILKDKLYETDPLTDHRLITVSVMYASKYYGVDFYTIEDFNREELRKYFNISEEKDILSVLCLGYFSNRDMYNPCRKRPNLSNILREV